MEWMYGCMYDCWVVDSVSVLQGRCAHRPYGQWLLIISRWSMIFNWRFCLSQSQINWQLNNWIIGNYFPLASKSVSKSYVSLLVSVSYFLPKSAGISPHFSVSHLLIGVLSGWFSASHFSARRISSNTTLFFSFSASYVLHFFALIQLMAVRLSE